METFSRYWHFVRGILTKASDAKLWCFLWSAPEQTVDQTIALIMTLLQWYISLQFIPDGPYNNTSELLWVMAWHKIGEQPLPEPMMTLFIDTNMRHQRVDILFAKSILSYEFVNFN